MNERYAFLLGAPKCGTSSLYAWLSEHPEIAGSTPKETFFFIDATYPLRRKDGGFHAHGAAGFEQFFVGPSSSGDRLRLEATTHTIYQREMTGVFQDLFPAARAIAVVRDPAKRILSAFNYTRNNRAGIDKRLTFGRYIDLLFQNKYDDIRSYIRDKRSVDIMVNELSMSDYLPHLQRWRAVLGDRLQIVQFERMVRQPAAVTAELFGWLGVDRTAADRIDFSPKNETLSLKWPVAHRVARAVRLAIGPHRMFRVAKDAYYAFQRHETIATGADHAAVEALRQYYEPLNLKLASEFPVDLSLWGK